MPHWGFTTEQFPYRCWWLHGDIVEEMTAWWTMWQAYIRNPTAHLADPTAFHERTWNLKQRLAPPTADDAATSTSPSRAESHRTQRESS